jgi:hypothetical protein
MKWKSSGKQEKALTSFENNITLGEICNTLRVVWGDAKRVAEGF